jgi:hypothetical protein
MPVFGLTIPGQPVPVVAGRPSAFESDCANSTILQRQKAPDLRAFGEEPSLAELKHAAPHPSGGRRWSRHVT